MAGFYFFSSINILIATSSAVGPRNPLRGLDRHREVKSENCVERGG